MNAPAEGLAFVPPTPQHDAFTDECQHKNQIKTVFPCHGSSLVGEVGTRSAISQILNFQTGQQQLSMRTEDGKDGKIHNRSITIIYIILMNIM